MEFVLQLIVNGILIGGIYALSAMGLAIIYKSTQVFNFAAGQMMAFGMFTAYTFMVIGIPLFLSIILGIFCSILLGWIIERSSLRPLLGQPLIASIMATFAILYVLRGVMLLAWQGGGLRYPVALPGTNPQIGPIIMSNELVWTFAMATLAVILVFIFFQRTDIGLGMRAAAEHQQLAQVRGIPVGLMYSVTWMLAAAVCAVAGIFVAFRLGISPSVADIGLASFPAVLLGGVESVPGALVGGVIIGLAVSLTSGLINPAAASIAPFVLLLIILIIKPEGLWGLKRIERI